MIFVLLLLFLNGLNELTRLLELKPKKEFKKMQYYNVGFDNPPSNGYYITFSFLDKFDSFFFFGEKQIRLYY